MTTETIRVPDIGMDAATCIEVTVKAGDAVSVDDTLIVLESDKASMDVPAPLAGTVVSIKVSEGDTLSEGDALLELETSAEATADSAVAAPAAKADAAVQIDSLLVPDIGMDSATVIEVSVKVGDTLALDDTVVVLESDKASMDVPATKTGTVTAIKVAEGDSVGENDLLLELSVVGESDVANPEPAVAQEQPQTPPPAAITEIKVPDIGMDSAKIIEVAVKPGDKLAAEDTLVVLESDKASMDVPAPLAGEVVAVMAKEGDDVAEGTVLISLQPAAAVADSVPAATAPAPATPATAPATAKTPPQPAAAPSSNRVTSSKEVHAGPAVRRLARELGVDLALVGGTGPRARILKDDVTEWVKQRLQAPAAQGAGTGLPTVPDQDFAKFGQVETVAMSRIQQLTAANMVRNTLVVPHVTQFDEADVTATESFRQSLKPEMEKRGVKISPLAFIVKACASALREFPNFNVSLLADGKHYVQKHYVHIGVAVDTPNGLVVPVIQDADQKSIWQLAAEIIDVAKRGRDGKLKPTDMQGGCFSVSSLGGLGGTAFTPIVNAPEVAILGVSKNAIKPQWNGREFEPRTMTPLSLSYDHRAINGADAARFTSYLCKVLADVRYLVM